MTLILEDGTGLATANSYGSVAEADTYFADRPTQNTTWAAKSTAEKEEALILATSYLDAEYGADWIGRKQSLEQALDWPREDAVTRDGFSVSSSVPTRLKRATFEAAFLSAPVGTVTLLPTITSPAAGIKRIKQKADVVEQEIEYSGAGAEQLPKFPAIDGLLQTLTGASGSGMTRIRG